MISYWAVCVKNNSKTEENLTDFIRENNLVCLGISYSARNQETVRRMRIDEKDLLVLKLKIPVVWANEIVWHN